jgi:hypothetical protein
MAELRVEAGIPTASEVEEAGSGQTSRAAEQVKAAARRPLASPWSSSPVEQEMKGESARRRADVYARVCSCRQCWASKCRGL